MWISSVCNKKIQVNVKKENNSNTEVLPDTKEQKRTEIPDKPKGKRKVNEFEAIAQRYAKSYPKNKVFYITSDRQVFLSDNKCLAEMHQRTIGTGEVVTIKID